MLDTIKASAKKMFTFFGPLKGDNQLATIAEINKVINHINRDTRQTSVALLNFNEETGAFEPSFRQAGGGCVVCTKEENDQFVGGCLCFASGASKYKGAGGIKKLQRLSAGIYYLDMDSKGFDPYNSYDINITNLAIPGYYTRSLESIEIVGKEVYVIRTYDATGALADGVLENANLELTFYTHLVKK